MCEANAYLMNNDQEVLLMESVDIIEPFEDGLKLVDIFGRQKFVRARIKDMSLLFHRIVLENTQISQEVEDDVHDGSSLTEM